MSNNKELGQEGELLAADYLSGKGWEIVEKNYRTGRFEVDIVAQKGSLLIFVEVKTRTPSGFGFPEDFVDRKKQDRIIEAANRYLEDNNWKGNIRFDIISIEIKKGIPELLHIEDAFY